MSDFVGWAIMFAAAALGCVATRRLFRPVTSVWPGQLGGAFGCAFGFVVSITVEPLLVIDPLLVASQLLLFSLPVGALVETVGQVIDGLTTRGHGKRIARRLLALATVGGLAFIWLKAFVTILS